MSQFPFTYVRSIQELYDYDAVFDFLGSGEFAAVFKATRKVTSNNMVAGELVALKVLPKNKLESDKAAKAVVNEVENLRRLKHRHCVGFREALQSDREVFVVLQLVKDSTELFSLIRTGINEKCAATIMKQILRALRYLHVDRRIVHRDLKPENIMIQPKTVPKTGLKPEEIKITLVDFGLSKYVGTNQRRRIALKPLLSTPSMLPSSEMFHRSSFGGLTSSMSTDSIDSTGSHTNSPVLTTPVGTLRYSAPETVRGMIENGDVPRKTTIGQLQKVDLFGAGIIAFVMLTAQMPFSGKTKQQLTVQMEQGPSFLAPAWSKLSPHAQDFVSRLLGPDPNQRMSAEQALKHPWIIELAPKDEDDLKEEARLSAAAAGWGGNSPLVQGASNASPWMNAAGAPNSPYVTVHAGSGVGGTLGGTVSYANRDFSGSGRGTVLLNAGGRSPVAPCEPSSDGHFPAVVVAPTGLNASTSSSARTPSGNAPTLLHHQPTVLSAETDNPTASSRISSTSSSQYSNHSRKSDDPTELRLPSVDPWAKYDLGSAKPPTQHDEFVENDDAPPLLPCTMSREDLTSAFNVIMQTGLEDMDGTEEASPTYPQPQYSSNNTQQQALFPPLNSSDVSISSAPSTQGSATEGTPAFGYATSFGSPTSTRPSVALSPNCRQQIQSSPVAKPPGAAGVGSSSGTGSGHATPSKSTFAYFGYVGQTPPTSKPVIRGLIDPTLDESDDAPPLLDNTQNNSQQLHEE
jgi:serine/threonine protein kinase